MSTSPIHSESPALPPWPALRPDTPIEALRADTSSLEALTASLASSVLERSVGIDLDPLVAREVFLDTIPLPASPHSSSRSSPEYSPPVPLELISDSSEHIHAVDDKEKVEDGKE